MRFNKNVISDGGFCLNACRVWIKYIITYLPVLCFLSRLHRTLSSELLTHSRIYWFNRHAKLNVTKPIPIIPPTLIIIITCHPLIQFLASVHRKKIIAPLKFMDLYRKYILSLPLLIKTNRGRSDSSAPGDNARN